MPHSPQTARSPLAPNGVEVAPSLQETSAGQPWMVDLARLYRAAETILSTAPDKEGTEIFLGSQYTLTSPVRVIRTDWAILDHWLALRTGQATQTPGTPSEKVEYVVLYRKDHELKHQMLALGEFAFLRAITAGGDMAGAEEIALGQDENFDLDQSLKTWARAGLLQS